MFFNIIVLLTVLYFDTETITNGYVVQIDFFSLYSIFVVIISVNPKQYCVFTHNIPRGRNNYHEKSRSLHFTCGTFKTLLK